MNYNHFYYADDKDYGPYSPGDKVRIKAHVPVTGGLVGEVVQDNATGVTVKFANMNQGHGSTMTFDSDDLLPAKER